MELSAEELIRDLGLDPIKNAETRYKICNHVKIYDTLGLNIH